MKKLPVIIILFLYSFIAEAVTIPGIERLGEEPYRSWIQGKRIGVLAHPASLTRTGVHIVRLLRQDPAIDLRLLFSPEHGLYGTGTDSVPDSIDPETGLPLISLYGPRQAPESGHWNQIDALLVDLQDVGVRYYTYSSTLALVLRSAKEAGKTVIVLDRPNPLGGEVVDGAVIDPELIGNFIATLPLATRHGMTIGEVGRFANLALEIEADLKIVPMSGWTRNMGWDETGIPWVAPSSALQTVDQVYLYAWFGALEAANLSVGRGTQGDQFRIYGAPWISSSEQRRILSKLRNLNIPGIFFEDAQWTPARSEFQGELCRGFKVRISDRKIVSGFSSLLSVVHAMRDVLGSQLRLSQMDLWLGSSDLRERMEEETPVEDMISQDWGNQLEFRTHRNQALIY